MMNKLMKKLAVVLTVATMAVAGGAAASANDGLGINQMECTSVMDAEYTVTIGQYGANVREAPSTDCSAIGYLNPGTKLEVSGNVYQNGKVTEWVRVWYGTGAGYVNECTFDYNAGSAYKASSNESTLQGYMDNHYASAAENESHMKGCYATVRVDNNYLALRSAPAYAAENEIEQLNNGELVQIVGDTCGSYIYVCSNSGTFGWVNAGFLH